MSGKILITGGCGFLGSNLACEALKRGLQLEILDNFSRKGSSENLEWLRAQGAFGLHRVDIRDPAAVSEIIARFRPDAVFHLAGQVAMTTSIADPRADFEINALGTLNVLEALRKGSPDSALLYSSTNKVYGDLSGLKWRKRRLRWEIADRPKGLDESLPLSFQSPYGCSKGAADQYILDHARLFGVRAAVFRHSSIFGGRQFATEDQGWVGWFIGRALEARSRGHASIDVDISGDGRQVRDLLFVDDLIELYFGAADRIDRIRGEAFNIGGGMANSISLLELFAWIRKHVGVKVVPRPGPARAADQRLFVADTAKALRQIGWQPRIGLEKALCRMVEWEESRRQAEWLRKSA